MTSGDLPYCFLSLPSAVCSMSGWRLPFLLCCASLRYAAPPARGTYLPSFCTAYCLPAAYLFYLRACLRGAAWTGEAALERCTFYRYFAFLRSRAPAAPLRAAALRATALLPAARDAAAARQRGVARWDVHSWPTLFSVPTVTCSFRRSLSVSAGTRLLVGWDTQVLPTLTSPCILPARRQAPRYVPTPSCRLCLCALHCFFQASAGTGWRQAAWACWAQETPPEWWEGVYYLPLPLTFCAHVPSDMAILCTRTLCLPFMRDECAPLPFKHPSRRVRAWQRAAAATMYWHGARGVAGRRTALPAPLQHPPALCLTPVGRDGWCRAGAIIHRRARLASVCNNPHDMVGRCVVVRVPRILRLAGALTTTPLPIIGGRQTATYSAGASAPREERRYPSAAGATPGGANIRRGVSFLAALSACGRHHARLPACSTWRLKRARATEFGAWRLGGGLLGGRQRVWRAGRLPGRRHQAAVLAGACCLHARLGCVHQGTAATWRGAACAAASSSAR